jgi:hypothetical protein
MYRYRVLTSFAGIFCAALAHAATIVCVTDVASLQAALTAAEGSTSTTIIEVARGTYALGGSRLFFTSTITGPNQGQLGITGGYNSDCSTHINNPALTVLDGEGQSGILSIASTGGISVRYLTLQNGVTLTSNAGLDAEIIAGGAGGIIIDYNIFRSNTAASKTALSVYIREASDTADLHLDGNLIVDNAATGSDEGAGYVDNGGAGHLYVTNNTIVGNVAPGTDVGGLRIDGNSATLSNNIAIGNSTTDLRFFATTPLLADNDVGTILGSTDAGSSGNISVDPQFSSSSDFHLLASSPLLGAGTLTPAGNLPTIDIEGHPRSYSGFVDMGAYERGDEIFFNDFEH